MTFRRRWFQAQALVEQIVAGHITLGRWQRDGDPRSWRFIGTDDGVEIEISEDDFTLLVDEMRRTLR